MKIVSINSELTITYSWHKDIQQGICGHLYEVIDYYFIIHKFIDTKIFLCVDFNKEFFKNVIENKYTFTASEVENILKNTIISNDFAYLKCNKLLLCDGNFSSIKNALLYTKLFVFPCGEREVYKMKNMIILQDDRIYVKSEITLNYVKKILLSKIKPPTKNSDKFLVYTTTNMRKADITKYDKSKIICLTNDIHLEGYTYLKMPVKNIFDEFGTYIYTPVSRQFDCSPRFIVECEYFNKKVIYDIDYHDIGLETRRNDIKNLLCLHLTENDDIINILKDNYE